MGRIRSPIEIGQRFGMLVVQQPVGRPVKYLCICDCGAASLQPAHHLLVKGIKSCGCGVIRSVIDRSTKHGHNRRGSRSPEYATWVSMRHRCESPKSEYFSDYWGRGILVCPSWSKDFQSFLDDMGPKPSRAHSLERIDNDRGYEPGNCCWATKREQSLNRRNTAWIGDMKLVLAAEGAGLSPQLVRSRRHAGWPDHRLLEAKRSRA